MKLAQRADVDTANGVVLSIVRQRFVQLHTRWNFNGVSAFELW